MAFGELLSKRGTGTKAYQLQINWTFLAFDTVVLEGLLWLNIDLSLTSVKSNWYKRDISQELIIIMVQLSLHPSVRAMSVHLSIQPSTYQ